MTNSGDAADMKPSGNGVLVKVTEESDVSSGGIFLTGSTKEKPSTGIVVAVGPGKKNDDGDLEPVDVKVGSTILYSKYSGVDLSADDGTELIAITDADVLAALS